MAYFDNAATTYPKPDIVYSFMDEFYRKNGANAGRGNYGIAQTAGELIADTRKRIQQLLHCPAKQVIFEPTATIATNIIIQGLISKGVKNIYITPFEHNSVTRTLHNFEKAGQIKVKNLKVNKDLSYDMEAIRYQFDDVKPELVVVSHGSNVMGLISPAEDIFSLAKKYDAYTLLDMAQTAGLVDINIGLDIFDFAVFAGHKTLYGPTGISGFVMKPDINFPSILFGGTGSESANQDMPNKLPDKYEMGTSNISGIAGLNAALRWIEETGIANIRDVEHKNRERLIALLNDYDFIKIVGNIPGRDYVGVVSCLIDGISSDSAGNIFSKNGVAVRTGLECAPFAHDFLGTSPAGTIRLSVSYFTSEDDFKQLKDVLNYIEENI